MGHRGTGVPGDGVGSASIVVVSDDAATMVVLQIPVTRCGKKGVSHNVYTGPQKHGMKCGNVM